MIKNKTFSALLVSFLMLAGCNQAISIPEIQDDILVLKSGTTEIARVRVKPAPECPPPPPPVECPAPVVCVDCPAPIECPAPEEPDPEEPTDPGPTPTQKTVALDTFEKPEYAVATQWKNSITRVLLDGQTTSVVLKSTEPCGLVSVPGINLMVPQNLTQPSAPTYLAGTYYDPLKPLTAENCTDAKYLQLDVNKTTQVGDATITVVTKVTKAPVKPSVQLNVEFNNWIMVKAYCNGGWCPAEVAGLQGSKLLNDHKVTPYKGHVTHSKASWEEFVLPFQLKSTFIEFGDYQNYIATLPVGIPSTLEEPWGYIHDEPKYYDMATLATRLNAWKTGAPGVKRMVTTPLRHKDLNPSSPTFAKIIDHEPNIGPLIDIHVPVAEEFCQQSWANSGDWFPCKADYDAAGKILWLYISNMSHGAEGGGATGAPDIVIDRSAVEVFGFYLMAVKYDVNGLLYYNSTEAWDRFTAGGDVWVNPYVYGGNGDGILMYPDRVNKKALPSIRLKLIREASQWVDIIKLAGLESKAKLLMVHTQSWDRDLAKFEALRTEALNKLP